MLKSDYQSKADCDFVASIRWRLKVKNQVSNMIWKYVNNDEELSMAPTASEVIPFTSDELMTVMTYIFGYVCAESKFQIEPFTVKG